MRSKDDNDVWQVSLNLMMMMMMMMMMMLVMSKDDNDVWQVSLNLNDISSHTKQMGETSRLVQQVFSKVTILTKSHKFDQKSQF